jgi:hypothetical protein
MINIQVQQTTGNWITHQTTLNNSLFIVSAMKQLASRFPNYRVRAVDQSGRVVDIL